MLTRTATLALALTACTATHGQVSTTPMTDDVDARPAPATTVVPVVVVSDPEVAYEREISRGVLIAELEEDAIELRFADTVRFPTNSTDLDRRAERLIDRMARVLRRNPAHAIAITGHADRRPVRSGPFESNEMLSRARASTVRAALVARGVAPERLYIEGEADDDPIAGGAPISMTLNRRVEVRILPDADEIADLSVRR